MFSEFNIYYDGMDVYVGHAFRAYPNAVVSRTAGRVSNVRETVRFTTLKIYY
jgi:hypothetical protein